MGRHQCRGFDIQVDRSNTRVIFIIVWKLLTISFRRHAQFFVWSVWPHWLIFCAACSSWLYLMIRTMCAAETLQPNEINRSMNQNLWNFVILHFEPSILWQLCYRWHLWTIKKDSIGKHSIIETLKLWFFHIFFHPITISLFTCALSL